MAFEGGGNNPQLGAEVLLEFTKSIQNIQHFGEVMEGLDRKFGSIDNRVNSLRNSLGSLSNEASRGTSDNLRKNIEKELNSIALANGVAVTSVGTAPFKVKQDTVRHIFRRIDAELNRAIARSIGDINIKLDPSFSSGQFTLGKSEFEAFNKEVARMIKTQVSNLTSALRKSGAEMVSPDALKGVQLDISKDTVKGIMNSVKRQILPKLLDPQMSGAGSGEKLSISQRDMRDIMNKVRKHVMDAVSIDLDGIAKNSSKDSVEQRVGQELRTTFRRIDSMVANYVSSIRTGLTGMDMKSMQVPMDNMSQALKKHIARDLGVSVSALTNTFKSLSVGETTDYELRRQFASLERTVTQKLTTGTSQIMAELKRTVRSVEIRPQSTLHDHLTREIRKINSEIITKIRQQVDLQFKALREEIRGVQATPISLRRSGRIQRMASDYARAEGATAQQQPVAPNVLAQPPAPRRTDPASSFGSDPFARRDAHFSQFGLQGAITNTFRHVLAGSMVGAPIMAVYQAIDTFKQSQLEQLKILQNFMLKDDFQTVDEEGNETIDFSKVESEIGRLVPAIKDLSMLYAVDYQDMSQVAGVASRLTNTVEEARQFMDYATTIQRLDSEGDLVETIAPGLEAIMGQFGKSVWQMDEAVRAFAVASNRTKTTTDELMNALSRSGSSLSQGNMSITDSTIFSALAVQMTGLSGENIGNMAKTIMTRMTLPTSQSTLGEYGIDTYETNDRGRNVRRDSVDILSEIANMVKMGRMGEDELDKIFYATAGGFQISKFLAFIESFNTLENENDDTLNFHTLREQAMTMTDEQVDDILAKSLSSTVHNMGRAGTSTNLALVSVLEEMRPQIDDLMNSIANLAGGIRENADLVAELIGVIGNVLLGYGAMLGARKLGEVSRFNEIDRRNQEVDRIYGTTGRYTGNVTPGTLSTLLPVLGAGVAEQLNDRKLVTKGMGDATVAPYLQELSRMDEMRQRELVNYLQANNPRNLAEFFVAMDESRGHSERGEGRRRVAPDTHRERALYGINRMARNSVFSPDMARDMAMAYSNRENFLRFNATSENRGTTRRLSNMGDRELRAFEESMVRSGRGINNVRELNTALRDFSSLQAATNFNSLTESINRLGRTASGNTFTRGRDSFVGFLDSIPRRTRSGVTALAGLGRQFASVAKQMALFYAIGDFISTGVQQAALSDSEKEVQTRRRGIEASKIMETSLGEDRDSFSNVIMRGIIRTRAATLGNLQNLFFGEGAALGSGDINEFDRGFLEWIGEEIGRGGYRELKNTGEYDGKSSDEYIQEYLNSTGKYDELNEAERELFKERAKQARIDEIEMQKYKEEVEEAQRLAEQSYLERGEYSYFSTQALKEAIESQVSELQEALEISQLEAVLAGHKTYSTEYYNIMRERLQAELDIQNQQLQGLRDFIQEKEVLMAEMRADGAHMTVDEETGERVKSDEYSLMETTYEEEKRKLETLEEDFKKSQLEIQKQQAELNLQEQLTQSEVRMRDVDFEKRMTELYGGLTMDRSSKEYNDMQIQTNMDYIDKLSQEISILRSQDIVDPNDELKLRIKSLEEAMLSTEMAIKELRLSSITNYKSDLSDFDSLQELDMLQAQVGLGKTDTDHPLLKELKRTQAYDRINELEGIIEELKAEYGSDTDPEILKGLERELVELQKQSLKVQLSLLEEAKKTSGTFNLPDGLQPMSEFDYMKSMNTHSSYTISAGDMNVEVVLPNVTGMTSSEQMKIIGQSFAEGMMSGKLSSYRHMLNANPWGYKNPNFM